MKRERKLIGAKIYNKKGLVFLHAKTLKDIVNHSLKQAKVFSQGPILFKVNASLCSNASQYSGAMKACKELAYVRLARFQTLLQTKRSVQFFYLSCK